MKTKQTQTPLDQPDTPPEGSPYPDDLFEDSRFPKKKSRGEIMSESIRRRMSEGKPWGRQKTYDYEKIRRLWLEGRSISEIKDIVGCQKDTVLKAVAGIARVADCE